MVEFVLAVASRRCHGLAQLWLLIGATTLAQPVQFSIELLPAGSVAIFSPKLASISWRPSLPPPRA
jgi:hypothetical protein